MSHESLNAVEAPAIDAPETTETVVEIARRKARAAAQASAATEAAAESAVVTPAPVRHQTRFRDRFPDGIAWGIFFWMGAMHVGAVAALWHFSWVGLASFFIFHFVTCCLGVTLGYHRLLTHGSMIVPKWVGYFCSLCGMLSAEGSPLMWVATHRMHHVHSDKEDDPHSPLDGFWWSHMLWFYPRHTASDQDALYRRWAPDLYKDPVHRFFDKAFFPYLIASGVVFYAVGEYFFHQGLSVLLWGVCARMVASYHTTWFVNSATHIWGYRNYTTTDESRNLWWVALISYGEGWHNNHHAHQRMAVHGHRWWEFDVTYNVIRLLRVLGLARNVQDKLPNK